MIDILHTASQFSNLLGSILMGLAIGRDENEWVKGEKFGKDKKVYAVLLHHPRFFTAGVLLLIFGFALEFGVTIYLKYGN